MAISSVCVYCGSSSGTGKVYREEATKLGQLFHEKGWKLIYGGGTTGLMGAIAQATMGPCHDGKVHGIIPDALVEKEREYPNSSSSNSSGDAVKEHIEVSAEEHRGVTPISEKFGETTIVSDMHSRKRLMAKESDAFVALPGGYGTLEEILECITWSQLGIHSKPVVLFNVNGYYDDLLKFIQSSIQNGFISAKNGEIIQVASTAEEVIDKIVNYTTPEGRFNLEWTDECDNTRHL